MSRKNGRNTDGRFAPGNPGRPKGPRQRATRAALELLDGETEALTRKAVEQALSGDTVALRLCLERIAPPRKDAPVSFALPPMQSAADAAQGAGAILDAVAAVQLAERVGQLVRTEDDPLAHVDRRRLVIDSTGEEGHLALSEWFSKK